MTHNFLHRLSAAVPLRAVPSATSRVAIPASQRLASTNKKNEARPRINVESESSGQERSDAEVQKHNDDVDARKGNAATDSSGAKPRINVDSHPSGAQSQEEVDKHNEDVKNRGAKMHGEDVTSEKETVEKNFWSEAGGRNKKE